MRVTLDGHNIFDEEQLEIDFGSFTRDSIERTVTGLDGVLSIDAGLRSRKIHQKGLLRAQSRKQINNRINTISAYIDGKTHTLITNDGEKLDYLLMDSFKVNKERADGRGIIIDYEIIYTQLV